MSRNSENVISYRKRVKRALIVAFRDKCYICEHRFFPYIYEFHHIDPNEKIFGIGDSRKTRSIQANCDEAKKCVMLCANCHRLVEYGGISIPLKSNFSEELYFKTIAELNGSEQRRLAKEREQVKKNLLSKNIKVKPNRSELKTLLRTTPFLHIARMYGVSDNGVRVWAKGYNLPYRATEIKTYSDQDWDKV
ncbi:hypothetical protein [Bacillus phage SDFMU_Pbc]|uniref:HNH endonuclease n=1 Tax=Bacillus phage SDFMU_Pbc TaxID=3076135 RepID=A0AA96KR45_9CAUD|nr:hypothetical protein [Bacillus phage SDFMU_Pbc]